MNIYRITLYAASTRYLGVDSQSTIMGRTDVVLSSQISDSEKWIIGELENGQEIRSLNNPYYKLNVGPSNNADVYTSNADTAMDFVPAGASDVYYIRSSSNPSKYLTASSRSNGASISWQALANSDLQKWKFTEISIGASGTVYASESGSLAPSAQTANAGYIYDFLMARGFTAQAACGILGNIMKECTMNPGAWQISNNLNNGYGLVQWTPGSNFINWAKKVGVISSATAAKINDLASNNAEVLMNAQLFYLLECIGNSSDFMNPAYVNYTNHTGYVMNIAQYKSSTLIPETLALVFHDHYERSGDGDSDLNKRKQYARNWYDELA